MREYILNDKRVKYTETQNGKITKMSCEVGLALLLGFDPIKNHLPIIGEEKLRKTMRGELYT